ncbi:MAG: SAM-dependent methyltransferase [Lachnospiraceae bacterium]|nr:SAM-dependent methyltransferase [Lachnospiraceae bacterium]
MKSLLGDEYGPFMKSYDEPSLYSLRVNTSKISAAEFERIAPYPIQPIPFAEGGYYISADDGWSKHPYYHAGLYYMQEASAMLPALFMPLDGDETVLDLCAAPGGKSTGFISRGVRNLVSNDISFSRSLALVKNLDLAGGRCCVTCEDPEKLALIWPECFDRIAVDAPCSGEGMFRRDRGLIETYLKKPSGEYTGLQKSILESAYRMLLPGGMIMYSTCTFSDEEDEQVILSLLDSHDDLELCSLDAGEYFSGPYEKYSDVKKLSGCIHVFPHKCRGEGHFLALIKKSGERYKGTNECKETAGICFSDLPAPVKELCGHLSAKCLDEMKQRRFLLNDDGFVYILPDCYGRIYRKGIRFVRTGTCLGRLTKGGNITAHTSFALSLLRDDLDNVIDLPSDSPECIKYLKGETLSVSAPKGIVLICTDGFPLGFAKSDGVRLKNLYEKGWVYR